MLVLALVACLLLSPSSAFTACNVAKAFYAAFVSTDPTVLPAVVRKFVLPNTRWLAYGAEAYMTTNSYIGPDAVLTFFDREARVFNASNFLMDVQGSDDQCTGQDANGDSYFFLRGCDVGLLILPVAGQPYENAFVHRWRVRGGRLDLFQQWKNTIQTSKLASNCTFADEL